MAWIRSQNKSCLYKLVGFYIRYFESGVFDIFGETIKGEEFSIGEYSTEEKALKVLNMIQETIDEQEEFKAQGEERRDNTSYKRLIKFIFQMPADEEV